MHFAVIFIYMLISVIIYAASKKTIIYEVVDGSLASEDTYQGFIVRDETVIKSDYSGSVNYFLKSGHKAGLETVICSVDETGRVYDRINEEADKTLSKEALAQIRAKLSSLTSGYNNDTFMIHIITLMQFQEAFLNSSRTILLTAWMIL